MNRKNLTAAVLAGLAGVAGIAGTAQAVNMNPDGLGQVLIYPYYTANMGNQTLLSVVNTTNQAKAVKVRFLEGFNSREVLDFNLYMSAEDVWTAAIAAGETAPTLYINDTSCTVPYLYANGGSQPFLDIRYKDNGTINGVSYDYSDAGPSGMTRAAEGHFEIIEMGSIDNLSPVGVAVTHDPATGMPANCDLLTEMWTRSDDPTMSGQWIKDAADNMKGNTNEGVGTTDIGRNSGGLFGGAAIVNADNGTMFSYDAIALQGFDKYEDGLGLNFEPGTIFPSLNSGDQTDAWVFFGPPTDEAFNPEYDRGMDGTDFSVDAVSAVFMHSNIVNEYVIDTDLNAATDWIITFPTKNFYADWGRMCEENFVDAAFCAPDYDGATPVPFSRQPFTKYFGQTMQVADGNGDFTVEPNCEVVAIRTWDREENTYTDPIDPTDPPGSTGPGVSPSLPDCEPGPGNPDCPTFETGEVPFQLCSEVNVLSFGEEDIFGTPTLPIDSEEGEVIDSLLLTYNWPEDQPYEAGWARIRFDNGRSDHAGLIGLPVTGFAAYEFENGYVDGSNVKANYGGLFRHKGLVTRAALTIDPQ